MYKVSRDSGQEWESHQRLKMLKNQFSVILLRFPFPFDRERAENKSC